MARPSFASPRMPLSSRQRLSGWTTDVIQAFSSDHLAKIQSSVDDALSGVSKAWDQLNAWVAGADDLEQRKKDLQASFPPPDPMLPQVPNPDMLTAAIPLFGAQAFLNAGARRLAAVYIVFQETAMVFTDMGNALSQAGLTQPAARVRAASHALQAWNEGLDQQGDPRSDIIATTEEEINQAFNAALAQLGLRRIVDDDKPGYFDALTASVGKYTEEPNDQEAPPLPTSGGGATGSFAGAQLGVLDPVTVLAIWKFAGIVAIAISIIATVYLISKIVDKYFGAATAAMDAAKQLQIRKTTREQTAQAEIQSNEQAVQAGTMTREEADTRNKAILDQVDSRNKEDSSQFKEETEKAAEAAAKASPGIGQTLLWAGIVGGGLFAGYWGLKLAKVI